MCTSLTINKTVSETTMLPFSLVVCSALFAFALATDVQQCTGKSYANLSENVQLTPCKKTPCRLKKGTNEHITIKFTPEIESKDVRNHVTGEVFGVPLPFVGVDGNSICSKVKTESGEEAACPLEAGKTYVYTDSFPILSIYPSVNVKVHWSLQSGGKDIICFEVPARIA